MQNEFDERPNPISRRDVLHAMAGAAILPVVPSSQSAFAQPAPAAGAERGRPVNMMLSLQELSDRAEIQDLLTRYCYAVDDRDWGSYRRLFTPDAIIDDTVTGGIRSGVEEHVSYLTRALAKIRISQHAISTLLLDVEGDHARARLHCSCPMVVDLGDSRTQVFFQGLWYRNRLARTAEGWKLKELMEEGYWNHNLPPGFRF
jgi:SnoaL-like domain